MTSHYWKNKVCVVTGASAGLGYSISKALAKNGAQLILVARREDLLNQVAEELGTQSPNLIAISADITSQQDVDRLKAEVQANFDSVDFVCNCAGQSTRGAVLETTTEEFQQLLEINFLATVRMTKAFAESLIEHKGHLVNIGSLASKLAPRYLGAYPASKFAVAAYSQQLRLEHGPEGLHVLLVCPGPLKREDSATRYEEQAKGLPAEAHSPGGGAKLKGIEPDWLAEKILAACEQRKPELVLPWKVRLLLAISQLFPAFGDKMLLKSTSSQKK